jgi:hypothetical protein
MGKSKKTNHNKSNKMRKTMKHRQGGMYKALQLGPRLTATSRPILSAMSRSSSVVNVNVPVAQRRGSSNAASSFETRPTPYEIEAMREFFRVQLRDPTPVASSQALVPRLEEIQMLTDAQLNALIEKAAQEKERRSRSTNSESETNNSIKEVVDQVVVPGITKGDVGKTALTVSSSLFLGPIHHIGFVAHIRSNLVFPLIDTICNKPLILFNRTQQRFMIRNKIKKDIKQIVNKFFESTRETYSSTEAFVVEIQKIIVFIIIYKFIRCVFESKLSEEEETCRTNLYNFIGKMIGEDKYDLVKQLYDIGY